jgi:hypothetical protein
MNRDLNYGNQQIKRVFVLVEGRTEELFVREVLGPWLDARGVLITAHQMGKPGHRGGIGEYPRAQREIVNWLCRDRSSILTTLFDFYGMPDSWPGRIHAAGLPYPDKALWVEKAIHEDIVLGMGHRFPPERFIPHVQIHEFEALVFTDPHMLCEVLRAPEMLEIVDDIRNDYANPEMINDSPETAPSKRLLRIFDHYRKTIHGVITTKRVGLPALRRACPHFDLWVSKLENLASTNFGQGSFAKGNFPDSAHYRQ